MNPKRAYWQSGFGIIEVLVAVGISGVLMLAMMSQFEFQHKEMRSIREKLAANETEQIVIRALNDSVNCRTMLTSPSEFVFDSTSLPAMGRVESGMIPIGSGIAVAVGQKASPQSDTLFVSSLELKEISNAGSPDQWQGIVSLSFDQTRLVRSVRPVTVRILFRTLPASPAAAKRVSDCSGESNDQIDLSTMMSSATPIQRNFTIPAFASSQSFDVTSDPSVKAVIIGFTKFLWASRSTCLSVQNTSGNHLYMVFGRADGADFNAQGSGAIVAPVDTSGRIRLGNYNPTGSNCRNDRAIVGSFTVLGTIK